MFEIISSFTKTDKEYYYPYPRLVARLKILENVTLRSDIWIQNA